jgi:predicted Zn finger-like uncharacterized protein
MATEKKHKTTGLADGVECPQCGAVLNVTALNVKIKGTRLRCSRCRKILQTCGGVIADIAESLVQSVSLEAVDAVAVGTTEDVPVAPAK